MILQADFPPDIRVEKEISSLVSNGYEVHLVCKNVRNFPFEETRSNLIIHRLRLPKILPSRFRNAWMVPLSNNPVWKQRISQVIKTYDIDVIHVHDLPLAPLAEKIGRKFHLPVIFDMHENYPAALKAWNKRGVEKIAKNVYIAKKIEKRIVKKVDRIIVVVEEQKERLTRLGVDPQRITIVSNTVSLADFRISDNLLKVKQRFSNDYLITYAGGLTENRGIDTLIIAFAKINLKIPSAKLLLIGKGRQQRYLEKMVRLYKIADKVIFTGWIDFDKVPDYIATSDICVIPQPANNHANTTIPHKLFQYMSLAKPVIVSNAIPLARIVKECKCGEVFESDNPEDLAISILKVYNSEKKYGANGKKSVEKKYNWLKSSEKLLSLYREI